MCITIIISSSRNTVKRKDNVKSMPSPRPYTTYNIFFQLERERILQHDLGVTPDLNSREIFDCSDEKYGGPALPSRYQDLLLPQDWYIPGKALRKKRQHRATHGKISFVDLSKKIASSWRSCDDQVKLFCTEVSDIGITKYKRAMQPYKKINCPAVNRSQSSSVRKHKTSSKPKEGTFLKQQPKTSRTMICQEICPQITSSSLNIPVEHSLLPVEFPPSSMDINNKPDGANVPSLEKNAPFTSMFCQEITPEIRSQITTSSSNLPGGFSSAFSQLFSYPKDTENDSGDVLHTPHSANVTSLVDMKDEEIINIWTSLDKPPQI
eukprot:CAMPEP_0172557028 /NCGR_PEP_ID=MMETSP1067-20121228/70989_1 /TAXON_ID=265564 ORGANISM="Thalassiosira punctigera, Strain Tpunct2005C2" /NCGR_SAMPLE_ID=MMETSP1067 /ASSEMBLY_ACC=CAM_ASM_000444 /LENGTH=321 /DNA_ID=CAMNT_0013346003 /DNA_START=1 /DNA_END=966 /DNA_ORIENTATION=+